MDLFVAVTPWLKMAFGMTKAKKRLKTRRLDHRIDRRSPRIDGKDELRMTEVDFTSDLWLFLSPWCEEKQEDARYFDAIALAWVTLWNYTIDPTSMKTGEIRRVCRGLFDIPTNELIEILLKRRAVFFPDDNRLIEGYRVIYGIDEFSIFVTFAEPDG